jgi:uncharacterized protein (TIGR02145 family)
MIKTNSSLILILVVFTLFYAGCRKDPDPSDPVTDIDGNIYMTVKIGDQLWMDENLKTTHLNDGTEIPLTKDNDAWRNLTSAGYCWYSNDEASYKDPYGAIYNGFAVMSGKICPAGWHVPAIEEWRTLMNFLGDSAKAGGKLKESGTSHWLSPNKGADNRTGFTALPAGIRYFEGTFASVLSYSGIWSATEVSDGEEWYAGLYYAEAALITNHRNKKYGLSVRCLKD